MVDRTKRTAAVIRAEAREAEEALRWKEAAALYREAIEAYPPTLKTKDGLHALDLEKLEARAVACEKAARRAGQEGA